MIKWNSAPFRRSRRHRWIGGVCGGMAEWLGWNPVVVPVLFVAGSIAAVGVPGSVMYVILWVLVPMVPRG